MNTITTIRFIADNREILITFLIALMAVIKLTAWGRSQALALDSVVGVIEALGARDVKSEVSDATSDLPAGVRNAISDSVAKADPKKESPSVLTRILRAVFLGA